MGSMILPLVDLIGIAIIILFMFLRMTAHVGMMAIHKHNHENMKFTRHSTVPSGSITSVATPTDIVPAISCGHCKETV